MTKLPRLHRLGVGRQPHNFHGGWIFHSDFFTLSGQKAHKESLGLHRFCIPLRDYFALYSHTDSAGVGQVGARRKSNYHIPPAQYVVRDSIAGIEKGISVKQGEHVLLDVPLWMPARAGDEVAAVRLMATLPQGYGNSLAFFTGNKNLHRASLSPPPHG